MYVSDARKAMLEKQCLKSNTISDFLPFPVPENSFVPNHVIPCFQRKLLRTEKKTKNEKNNCDKLLNTRR